ncbi:MAG: hypothetical protein ACI8UO_000112 [Verrucomicrobiales bacterium]|jgi:hypothetical protein
MVRFVQPLILTVFILGLSTNAELACDPENSLFDWPGFLLIGLAGVLSVLAWGGKAWGQQLPSLSCVGAFLVFAIWIASRAWLSPVEYLGRGDLTLLGVFAIVYALNAAMFAKASWRCWLIGVQVLVAFANVGLAIYQAKVDPGFHPLPWTGRSSATAGGLFENSAHFAGFLLVPACMLGGILVGGKPKAAARIFAALGLGLCLGGLVLAVSRTAFLAAGVGVFTLAVFAFWPARVEARHRWTAPLGVLAVALALILSAIWVIRPKSDLRSQAAEALASPRFEFQVIAWNQAQDQPIVGTGARTYEIYHRQFRPESIPAEVEEQALAGNEPLQLLAEYGWIGLVLGIACVGIHVGYGVRAIRRELAERRENGAELASGSIAWTIGAIAGLLALLVLSFFETIFHVPAVSLLAAMALGILANPAGSKFPTGRPAAAGAIQAFAVICGLLLIIFGHRYAKSDLREFEAERLAEAGELEASVDKIKEARELDPADPFLPMREAELALEIYGANLEVAADCYLESYELYPQNPRMLIALGQTLDELGRSDSATRYFEEALFRAPTYGVTRYAWANHLLKLGREAEANQALQWANEATAYRWTAEVGH